MSLCCKKHWMKQKASFIGIPEDIQTEEHIARARAVKFPIPKVLVLYTGGTIGMKIEENAYTPVPNFLEPSLRDLIILNDPKIRKEMIKYDEQNDFLYLPAPINKSPIAYFILEYEPLLDSSCMGLEEYKTIIHDIQAEYDYYNGFVILHGTDTMSYTASYLSFMLVNLDKPVVLTGSQIPIFETRSDGRDNLSSALIIAGLYDIPEVTILFDNKLLRGNRTIKVDCQGLHAFDSPNFPPIAEFGTSIQVRWDIVLPKQNHKGLKVFTDMSSNVGVIRIFPSLNPTMIELFCKPPLEAIILHTFGMGNVPVDNPEFVNTLKTIAERDLLLLNCTQCQKGSVSSIYEAGAILPKLGIASGRDLTIECALAKLSYIAGHTEWTIERKRKCLGKTLRGEMCEDISGESSLCSIPVEAVNCIDAVRSGSVDMLNIALEVGKDSNIGDRCGLNALAYAVMNKSMEMIKVLRKGNAKIGLCNHDIGIIACRFASLNDITGLKCLRLAGASLSEGDYYGNTACHIAAKELSKEAFVYLMSINSDLTQSKNYSGETPKKILKTHQNTAVARQFKLLMKSIPKTTPSNESV